MDIAIDHTCASAALDLSNIRYQLIRLEDTIIFYLIERVQFSYSPSMYTPGGIDIPNFTGSFLDWMLLQQERVHAQVRRYEAPDEYPFFPEQLPAPFLKPLPYPRLLHPNTVNINKEIKDAYTSHILPVVCALHTDRGADIENYGSAAVADVFCLQALSRRIHFGKFVAEAKFRERPEEFATWIRERNIKALQDAITKPAVELQVLKRLELKARTYGTDPSAPATDEGKKPLRINVDAVVAMYRDWVIPMTKEVEINYLLQRLNPPPPITSPNSATYWQRASKRPAPRRQLRDISEAKKKKEKQASVKENGFHV